MNFPINIFIGELEAGKPVFYKEGFYDSASETPPTGTDAAEIADGSFIMDTDTGAVKQYNKASDTWKDRFTLAET